MIAGVGSIDLALLVVAADDGWMPQTEEHFQILNYLGVQRAVMAITKADLEITMKSCPRCDASCMARLSIILRSFPFPCVPATD